MNETSANQSSAWSPDDLRDSPHRRTDKPERVRRMFASIAPAYDLNNRLHSFGRDQAWRRCAVRMCEIREGDVALDVACGTGDLTALLAGGDPKTGAKPGAVIGLDFTREMLACASEKRSRVAAGDRMTYVHGDAQALPLADGSVDVVTIAFGIRNVGDTGSALREFWRVLRPGGRLVVLEFSTPWFAPLRWGNDLYTKRIMPWTATLIARDRSGAYRYLPKSVETYLTREEMCGQLESNGFGVDRVKSMTFGVCVCYRATKGAPASG